MSVFFPGPSFHVDLAPLDALHPVHYSRRLLIFRCSSSAQRDAQLAALKTGLQALVLRCPILGGITSALPPDEAIHAQPNWCTIIPDKGIELVVKDLRTIMASFEELEAAHFPPIKLPYALLVPVPQHLGNDRPFATCKMQFSAIDGGTIITVANSHSVADGGGINEIMRVLSEEMRFAQDDSKIRPTAATTPMGQDRSLLRNITSDIPFDIEQHPGYKWDTPAPASTDFFKRTSPEIPKQHATYGGDKHADAPIHPFKATSPEVPILLRISPAGLAQLKADATMPDAPMISTHDALSALVWRSLLLIRSRRSASAQDLPASTIGSFFMPSDARRHLGLPPSYIGNAVYQLTATLDLGTLFSPSGLQYAASAVRRSITAVKPALVVSMMTMLKEKWVGWGFMDSYATTGVAMGTGWTSGSVYSLDWGKAFGPLVKLRYPDEAFSTILPKLPDGGAEVQVGVMPEEVEVLRGVECFGKYIDI